MNLLMWIGIIIFIISAFIEAKREKYNEGLFLIAGVVFGGIVFFAGLYLLTTGGISNE